MFTHRYVKLCIARKVPLSIFSRLQKAISLNKEKKRKTEKAKNKGPILSFGGLVMITRTAETWYKGFVNYQVAEW